MASQKILTHLSLVRLRRESKLLAPPKPRLPAVKVRDGLLSLPDGLGRVEERAFQDRKDITSLSLPESVKEIGDWAFSGCENLAGAVLPQRMQRIGFGAFWGCKGLVSFTVPEGVELLDFTFVLCENLERISLPSTLRAIEGAFSLAAMREISLPQGLRSIGADSFHGCRYLREISIPDSVTAIGASAFANCRALKRAERPASFRAPEKQTMLDEAGIPEEIRAYRPR